MEITITGIRYAICQANMSKEDKIYKQPLSIRVHPCLKPSSYVTPL